MPRKGKVTVTLQPDEPRWSGHLEASAPGATFESWFHLTGYQRDTLVLEAYTRGPVAGFTLGPTGAADETKPGTVRVEVGRFDPRRNYVVEGVSPTILLAP